MPSPFLRPDAVGLGQAATDAAVCLLAETGVPGLTSRAIASWLRITPSALSQQAGRKELLRLVFLLFADRWEQWASVPPWDELPARLPASEDELHGVRVWHALAELARGEALAGNPVPADVMIQTRRDERALSSAQLARLLDRAPTDVEVDGTAALVTGLRFELTAPQPTLSHAAATDLLRAHVRHLRAEQEAAPAA